MRLNTDQRATLTTNFLTVHQWAMMYRGRSVVLTIDNTEDGTMTISLETPKGEEIISGLARDMPRLIERAAEWTAFQTQCGRGYERTGT